MELEEGQLLLRYPAQSFSSDLECWNIANPLTMLVATRPCARCDVAPRGVAPRNCQEVIKRGKDETQSHRQRYQCKAVVAISMI